MQKEEDKDTFVYVDHLIEANLINLFLNCQMDVFVFDDMVAAIFFTNNK